MRTDVGKQAVARCWVLDEGKDGWNQGQRHRCQLLPRGAGARLEDTPWHAGLRFWNDRGCAVRITQHHGRRRVGGQR